MTSHPQKDFNPKSVLLEGKNVRLEPLTPTHADDLFEHANFESIWRYLPAPQPTTVEAMRETIAEANQKLADGVEVPFAIVHKPTGRAIGSTRYLDIQRLNRGLEIGWTWITPEFQRSLVNTECKILLLQHAFEELGAIRVLLKTDSRNVKSQNAILRIGAAYEGTLRNHYLLADGYRRDTVMFSITEEEWPSARERLSALNKCYLSLQIGA